jgi:hypothetical protein
MNIDKSAINKIIDVIPPVNDLYCGYSPYRNVAGRENKSNVFIVYLACLAPI